MYESALSLLQKINDFGFDSYIVGGYPRDLYMDRKCIDIDICTNATPKDLKDIFKDSILAKQEYGGVTVMYQNVRFEITTFRKEIKYENNRFPVKIKYIKTLMEDLKRRDFTINTMCINAKGEMIDLYNAKEDINNQLIKTVGQADNKIKTDILRSLRAIRFATILNFNLDDKLKKSIKKYGYLLKKLSYYRKKEELDKIFNSVNNAYGISLLIELGLIKHLELPNLENIQVTTSSLGIWAQIEVEDYNFSKHEKEIIKDVRKAMDLDILDSYTLYNYGLYVCTIVGEIKKIKQSLIVAKYNSLVINSKKDIAITAPDICKILNKKPDITLKNIIADLEKKIVNGDLINDFEALKKYIILKYDS